MHAVTEANTSHSGGAPETSAILGPGTSSSSSAVAATTDDDDMYGYSVCVPTVRPRSPDYPILEASSTSSSSSYHQPVAFGDNYYNAKGDHPPTVQFLRWESSPSPSSCGGGGIIGGPRKISSVGGIGCNINGNETSGGCSRDVPPTMPADRRARKQRSFLRRGGADHSALLKSAVLAAMETSHDAGGSGSCGFRSGGGCGGDGSSFDDDSSFVRQTPSRGNSLLSQQGGCGSGSDDQQQMLLNESGSSKAMPSPRKRARRVVCIGGDRRGELAPSVAGPAASTVGGDVDAAEKERYETAIARASDLFGNLSVAFSDIGEPPVRRVSRRTSYDSSRVSEADLELDGVN